MRELASLNLLNGTLTVTAAGTEVDLGGYLVSPGKREMMAIADVHKDSGNAASDTFSIDIKLQESPTTVDSDFTDISGAAFTQVTEAASGHEAIFFQTLATTRYVREYSTIAGSGNIEAVVNMLAVRRLV